MLKEYKKNSSKALGSFLDENAEKKIIESSGQIHRKQIKNF